MWRIQEIGSSITVECNGLTITVYQTDPSLSLPYFYPVRALSGEEVCAIGPQHLYPHHRSVWIGHGNVNGVSFWLDRPGEGQIRHEQTETITNSEFTVRSLWISPDGTALMHDARSFQFRDLPEGWLMICHLTVTPLQESLVLGKTNHAFFSVRVRPEIAVTGGGKIWNSEGKEDESETMGARARWCLYGRELSGRFLGVALLDAPENPWHPSPWFARDYGFLSPSPFYWQDWTIERNEPLRLRYGLLVCHQKPDMDKIWQIFSVGL
ncbi:MAG: PmoA family protein [Armatimonadetes bacterium]|nr:PmoA family protein [Armatimonadota bacterium]MDW8121470.1 PmoA family protein [Armatimonadota bacterium]